MNRFYRGVLKASGDLVDLVKDGWPLVPTVEEIEKGWPPIPKPFPDPPAPPAPPVEEIPHATVVNLKPGDVIVLHFPGAISQDMAERIAKHCETVWPEHKLLVCGDGMRLTVVSPQSGVQEPTL